MRHPQALIIAILSVAASCNMGRCSAAPGPATNALASSSASTNAPPQRLNQFLSLLKTNRRDEARRFYATDARMWFDEKSGGGMAIGESPWREWDEEMHATHRVEAGRVDGNMVVVVSHEVNDFARLLDFPGWRARMTYWFNACGEVVEILYAPMAVTPTLAECMEPAVIWLKANRPAQLIKAYAREQIVPSRANAKAWRMMLEDWRSATGRGEVKCSAR